MLSKFSTGIKKALNWSSLSCPKEKNIHCCKRDEVHIYLKQANLKLGLSLTRIIKPPSLLML